MRDLCIHHGQLYSAGEDGTLRQWDMANGSNVNTLPAHGDWVTACCAVGNFIFTASADGTIKIWDLATGACVATLEGHQEPAPPADQSNVQFQSLFGVVQEVRVSAVCSLAVLEGGRLASGSIDATIKTWDPALSGVLR